MDLMRRSLQKKGKFQNVQLPESRIATERVLVMTFLDGRSIANYARASPVNGGKAPTISFGLFLTPLIRRKFINDLLNTLARVWGHMIFVEGTFNAVKDKRSREGVNIILTGSTSWERLNYGQFESWTHRLGSNKALRHRISKETGTVRRFVQIIF